MLTKLTLTVDKEVIDRAKKYARSRNKSISRMVEEYLETISDESERTEFGKSITSPITDSIVGMFKDTGEEYKKLLEDALMEKFV